MFFADEAYTFEIICPAPLVARSSNKHTRKAMAAWLTRLQNCGKRQLEFEKTAAQIVDIEDKQVTGLQGIFLRSIEDVEDASGTPAPTLYSFAYDQAKLAPVVHMTRQQFIQHIQDTATRFGIIGMVFGMLVGAAVGAFAVYTFIKFWL